MTTRNPHDDRRADPNDSQLSTGDVEKATTLIRTSSLHDKGIDQIRVLSESKFLGLVRGMVEESLQGHLGSVSAPPPASAPSGEERAAPRPGAATTDLRGEFQGRWEGLRKRHEEKLVRIESGMRRLASTFDGIKDALSSLERTRNAGPAGAVAARNGDPGARSSTAGGSSQQALLREMLL